jgi:hypothetical protein
MRYLKVGDRVRVREEIDQEPDATIQPMELGTITKRYEAYGSHIMVIKWDNPYKGLAYWNNSITIMEPYGSLDGILDKIEAIDRAGADLARPLAYLQQDSDTPLTADGREPAKPYLSISEDKLP